MQHLLLRCERVSRLSNGASLQSDHEVEVRITYIPRTADVSAVPVADAPLTLAINPLTPNDHYNGRTALLISKPCILYIYSTDIGTEYFKQSIYSPFFSLQNAVSFIMLTYLVPVLFTFYMQGVLKFKKIIPAPKG